MINSTLQKFVYSVDDPVRTIVSAVIHQGLVIIPNYFKSNDVERVNTEVSRYFQQLAPKDECAIKRPMNKKVTNSYMAGKVIRIGPSSYDMFPTLSTLFVRNLWMHNIVDSYYGVPNNKFMQIFATHETIPRNSKWDAVMNHNSGLHFDPYQALKIATYLQDTTKENGAFRIIPGSAPEGRRNRENLKPTMWKGESVLDCVSPFKHSEYSTEDALYVEAPSGSLILFDTDAWHGGGEIHQKGLERKFVVCHNRKR